MDCSHAEVKVGMILTEGIHLTIFIIKSGTYPMFNYYGIGEKYVNIYV